MPGQMCVQSFNTNSVAKCLKLCVVLLVRHLWHLPAVTFKNINHRRQQLAYERHACLYSLSIIYPCITVFVIVLDIKCLHVRIRETRKHLDDE